MAPSKRPPWLAAEDGLKRFELPDTVAGRRRMVEHLDRRAMTEGVNKCGVPVLSDEVDARRSHLRRGWYWGGQKFADKVRKLSEKLNNELRNPSRGHRRGPQAHAHGEDQAERWLASGLKAAGLKTSELAGLKGSDPRKLALAELLWKRTTVSQEWISKKLSMRSAANVGQQLRLLDRRKLATRLPVELTRFLDEA